MGLMMAQTNHNLKDLIFNGRLISIKKERKDNILKAILTFKVIRYYNGTSKDTIKIWTNHNADACGFQIKINTNAFIFARKGTDNNYSTWRSDCCLSTSEQDEKQRYDDFITFFDSIIDRIDGDYVFHQTYSKYFFSQNIPLPEILKFSIKNGQFHGEWKIVNKSKVVLEQGYFKNGKRHGKWTTTAQKSSSLSDGSEELSSNEIIFENGKVIYAKVIIDDLSRDKSILRRQIFHKKILQNGQLISIETFNIQP